MFTRQLAILSFYVALVIAQAANSQTGQEEFSLLSGQNYLARIGTNSPQDLERSLIRMEQLFATEVNAVKYDPIVMVLHGPEVSVFLRDNYINSD